MADLKNTITTDSGFVKKNNNFFIHCKREFIITYATTFDNNLTLDMINSKYNNWFDKHNKKCWEYIACLAKGHEEGDKHDHFHVYLRWSGTANGFSTRRSDIFDIPFNKEIEWTTIEGVTKKLNSAHPNIQFKKSYKDTLKMMKYVIDQGIDIKSNFDYKKEVEMYTKSKSIKRTRSSKKESEELEPEFCEWLRKMINENPYMTKEELLSEIKKDSNKWLVYTSKFTNYNNAINYFFRHRKNPKPTPNYDLIFYVPIELYDYILYLDNLVRIWMTDRENYPKRPKGAWITGSSRTGKTSLFSLLGPFSYFCNVWSIDNYESESAFHLMEDFDTLIEKASDFNYLKGWVGSQEVITMTDKYREKCSVKNGRPLIFTNNNTFDDLVKYPKAKKYIRQNMEIIEIGDRNLYDAPRNNIDDFAKYTKFDPKQTWYYKNIVANVAGNSTLDSILIESPSIEPIAIASTSEKVVADENKENIDPRDTFNEVCKIYCHTELKPSFYQPTPERMYDTSGRYYVNLLDKELHCSDCNLDIMRCTCYNNNSIFIEDNNNSSSENSYKSTIILPSEVGDDINENKMFAYWDTKDKHKQDKIYEDSNDFDKCIECFEKLDNNNKNNFFCKNCSLPFDDKVNECRTCGKDFENYYDLKKYEQHCINCIKKLKNFYNNYNSDCSSSTSNGRRKRKSDYIEEWLKKSKSKN